MARNESRKAELHGPWLPTPAEILQSEYSDEWDIWRVVNPGGSHGDWCARALPTSSWAGTTLTAPDTDELGQQLAAHTAASPVCDWRVMATIEGQDHERATGRARDLDTAAERVTNVIEQLPVGLAATGVITETGGPARVLAKVTRDMAGRVEWTRR